MQEKKWGLKTIAGINVYLYKEIKRKLPKIMFRRK
jgi:hypothetical protein